jgi:FHA domain
MGAVVGGSSGLRWHLQGAQTLGRGPGCAPRASEAYISTHHAELCWRGGAWQLKDLGSRNGTFVNSNRLEPGDWLRLSVGDKIALGALQNSGWELADDSPPSSLLVPSSGGPPIPLVSDLIGLPAEQVRVTLWRTEDGGWWFETEDAAARQLKPQHGFELDGQTWRLVVWDSNTTTDILLRPREVGEAELVIRHSLDEEHVEVELKIGKRCHSLGERQHHYVLLLLARQRLADRENGEPEGSCGWVYQDDFARQLGVDRTQLNLSVFRIRQQFAALGCLDPASVIVRRAQTKQLRLGVQSLTIERV